MICINILNFNLVRELDLFHTCFMPYEYKNKEILLTEQFQIHFLEIPKFKTGSKRIKQDLEEWFEYFINEGRIEEEEMKGILDKKPEIKKAHKQYQKFTQDDSVREFYEARLKKERDVRLDIIYAKEEGIKEGVINTAKNLLKMGIPLEQISKATGLSEIELKKLLTILSV